MRRARRRSSVRSLWPLGCPSGDGSSGTGWIDLPGIFYHGDEFLVTCAGRDLLWDRLVEL